MASLSHLRAAPDPYGETRKNRAKGKDTVSKTIQSPIPGTFYRKPSPEEPPFVEDGASVMVGDTIGLIEVMKTFIEVKAEVGGTNARFAVDNEEPVVAGALLVELD